VIAVDRRPPASVTAVDRRRPESVIAVDHAAATAR